MAKRKTSESVQKRRDRVFDLFVIDGHEDTAEIARTLMAEGVVRSKTIESALRLIQSDVALFRDVGDQRRYVERRLYAMRGFRRIAADDSAIEYDVVTPKGETVSMSRPKWPASVRARALAYFSEEAEALARCALVDVTGKKRGKGAGEAKPRFRGAVPVDLSALSVEDREAIGEAMQRFPGGEDDERGAPN